MMEGPLNLAHLQGRKAEQYLAAGKFDDAIACHQRAAEYLDEALSTTTKNNALESIRLQRESHIKEQDVIKMKKQKAAMVEKARIKEQQKLAKGRSQTQDGGDETDDKVCDEEQYMTMIYTTMAETDSLLQFMGSRPHRSASAYQKMIKKLSSNEDSSRTGSKVPKDDKQVIEELRIHNVELRKHLERTLNELDSSRQECRLLKDRLKSIEDKPLSDSSEGSETFCAVRSTDMLEDLPSLELPPLEMPKFDFQAFKDFEDEHDE
ncbi:nuclear receptor-binding factor 2-like [Lineus longissimus]|uniref:nuclear receptor-binding factor 2-like n=1 Tax=Lineus longissimus TaxID=88925 RepID=UPI002B4CBE3C